MKEFDIMSYKAATRKNMQAQGIHAVGFLTGHHIIPDHCFYVAKGARQLGGSLQMLIKGASRYNTNQAPVIVLSSDATGGKVLNHGRVHAVFDPAEKMLAKIQSTWTYAEVKALAIQSVIAVTGPQLKGKLSMELDNYFVNRLGMKKNTMLRCGEHTKCLHLAAKPPRKSMRLKGIH